MLKRFSFLSIFCSADSTFGYTTTSPCILFLQKRLHLSEKLEETLNYQVFLINSPKMFLVASDSKKLLEKERNFLGYEFSQSRNKSGIKIINSNSLVKYSQHIKNLFLGKGKEDYKDENSRTSLISDIILRDEKGNYVIYPRYQKLPSIKKGFYLKEVCQVNINDERILENHLDYVEISNIQNNKISGPFKKNKQDYRIARKGDILISSLTPSNKKIVLVDNDYKVSKAIHVLTFKDREKRDYVYNYLLANKNNVFEIFNSLLDGFKITYSKVSEFNLLNYV